MADAGIALTVYLVFLAWYDGWPRRRLSAADTEMFLEKIRTQRAGMGEAAKLALERFGAIAASDDGGEFHMVNLLRWRRTEEGRKAHKRYLRAWARAAVPRASHPTYRGKVVGKVQGNPEAQLWDDVVLMRYRSRRDLLKIVTDEEFLREQGQKSLAVDYTDAYPAVPSILVGSPRVIMFLVLLVLALAIAAVFK